MKQTVESTIQRKVWVVPAANAASCTIPPTAIIQPGDIVSFSGSIDPTDILVDQAPRVRDDSGKTVNALPTWFYVERSTTSCNVNFFACPLANRDKPGQTTLQRNVLME